MTTSNNQESGFDRQLGVATSRMDEHDRRLQNLEGKSDEAKNDVKNIEARLENLDARLGTVETNVAEIKTAVTKIAEKASKLDGFLLGVKTATNFWYVIACAVFGIAGFVLSKFLS